MHASSSHAHKGCGGFFPIGWMREGLRAQMPSLHLDHNMSGRPESKALPSPRRRIAVELSGCMRTMGLAAEGKIHAIRKARAAGFAIDVFCKLEACSEPNREPDSAEVLNGIVANFIERVSPHLGNDGKVVECSWYPFNGTEGLHDGTGRLQHQYRTQEFGYLHGAPICHFLGMSLDNVIAQARKLWLVGRMRQQFAARVGQQYDLVWRQRPDWVSTGLDFHVLRGLLLGEGMAATFPASPRADFVLPQLCASENKAHTDIEAILTTEAADHYDEVINNMTWLWDAIGGYYSGPEVVLDLHMRRFRHYVQHGWQLYRCDAECFTAQEPCRRATPTPMDATHPHSCGLPRLNISTHPHALRKGACNASRNGPSKAVMVWLENTHAQYLNADSPTLIGNLSRITIASDNRKNSHR